MNIRELQTSYSKRCVIEYGTGPRVNTPVRHWHEVQQIEGPLYKGREERNQYGELQCNLYLFYDGVQAGLRFCKGWRIAERDTPEFLFGLVQKNGLHSLDGFFAVMKNNMEESRWIGQAEIEFVRQFDAEKAARYAQYRQKRKEAADLESRRRAEEKSAQYRAKLAEEEKEKAAQRAEERAKYEGWADILSPLQYGRAKKVLEKKIRWEGKILPRWEFIKSLLARGFSPVARQDKGKHVFWMADSERKGGYIVKKTEFDFASFLAASKKNTVE